MKVTDRQRGSPGMIWVQALLDDGRLVRFVIADDADASELEATAKLVAEHQQPGLGFLDPNAPIPEAAYEERKP